MIEEPYIIVRCDSCEDEHEREMRVVGSGVYSPRYLEDELKEEGWSIPGDDVHICPNCVEESQEQKENQTFVWTKHLASHGLTPEGHKAKWGYKKNQFLVAKSWLQFFFGFVMGWVVVRVAVWGYYYFQL